MKLDKVEAWANTPDTFGKKFSRFTRSQWGYLFFWFPLIWLMIALIFTANCEKRKELYAQGIIKTNPETAFCYDLNPGQCLLKIWFNKRPGQPWCNGYPCSEYLPKYWKALLFEIFDYRDYLSQHWTPPVMEPIQGEEPIDCKKVRCA